jgi:hypothetical protein
MDRRRWMDIENRRSRAYMDGVETFIRFIQRNAFQHGPEQYLCPCKACHNMIAQHESTIRTHLLQYGMLSTYTLWFLHGEVPNTISVSAAGRESRRHEASSSRNVDPVVELVEDLFQPTENFGEDTVEGEHPTTKAAMDAYDELTRLANTPLFAGSNLSCLESLLKLMTIKEKSAASNTTFDMNCEF